MVTAKGQYPFYARLDEIEKQLSPDFVRIHQRYLVHPAHVDYLGKPNPSPSGDRSFPAAGATVKRR